MIIFKEDLDKVKEPEKFKYNVYKIISKMMYCGYGLVAAENSKEANHIIEVLQDNDPKNHNYSRGYNFVDESDQTKQLSDIKGIVFNNIHYEGINF